MGMERETEPIVSALHPLLCETKVKAPRDDSLAVECLARRSNVIGLVYHQHVG